MFVIVCVMNESCGDASTTLSSTARTCTLRGVVLLKINARALVNVTPPSVLNCTCGPALSSIVTRFVGATVNAML